MAKDKTFETVSVFDPAIDNERMSAKAMGLFTQTRDMKHLIFRPGKEPTIYSLRMIPHNLWNWVDSGEQDGPKFTRAFRASLRGVTNMLNEDGTNMGKDQWVPAFDEDGTLKDESVQRFDRFEINEIGGMAFVKSFFGKRTPPTYLLPPLLAAHLADLTYLRADANPSSPVASSAGASAPVVEVTNPA